MKRSKMSPRGFALFVLYGVACYAIVPEDALGEPFVPGFDRFGRYGDVSDVLAGKLLISELSCAACHAADDDSLAPKRGPNLHDAAVRLTPGWIREFVANPHDAKPGTTMPDVLSGKTTGQRAQIAEQLTAFLMSQTGELSVVEGSGLHPVPFQFWKKGDKQRGKALYHRVGCVACHQPDESFAALGKSVQQSQVDRLLDELDPEELADMGLASAARRVHSVPISELPKKYSPKSLTHFLLAPAKYRPGGRMPNMKLSAMEAADIAAYLSGDAAQADLLQREQIDADVQAGREHFSSLGCTQCHQVGGQTNSAEAFIRVPEFEKLSTASGRGCFGGTVVDYRLDDDQLKAIREALESIDRRKPSREDDELDLTLLRLNCLSCHEREGLGGVGRYRKKYFHTVDDVDLGDEGRLPPPLTGVGAKLTGARLKDVFAANKADVRPHMHVRMPVFPKPQIAGLPQQLAAVDSADSSGAKQVFGDHGETAEIGRQLMDIGCVQCHAFGGQTLPGVVGVDLSEIQKRVHPRWFHDFLLNPGSLKLRTRMPTFFPDGKSQHPGLLDGDATKQIGAMWAYLSDLPKQELPEKIEKARAQDYELVPSDAPIVLRTFVEDVGTHAVAVGFPASVHYVFDTETCRPATAWRGRFMDAQGTWFIRFAPPASLLGNDVISMPSGGLFKNGEAVFRGYRLDSVGVPEFLYSVGGNHVSDRIVPDGKGGLLRTVTIEAADTGSSSLVMILNEGKSLIKDSKVSYTNEHGLTTLITQGFADSPNHETVERESDVRRWTIPINGRRGTDPTDAKTKTRIQVRYSW